MEYGLIIEFPMLNIQPQSQYLPSVTSEAFNRVTTDINNINKSFVSGLSKKGDWMKILGNNSNNLVNNVSNKITKAINSPANSIIGLGGTMIESGLGALGVKQADPSSMSLAERSIGTAANLASFIPGVGTAASAVLKGFDIFNRHAGRDVKKMGTDSTMDNAYSFNSGSTVGRVSFLGRLAGKGRKYDALNREADTQNLKGNFATAKSRTENEIGLNTAYAVDSLNRQNLMGTANTNILSAKKGAYIDPAYLKKLANQITIEVKVEISPQDIEDNVSESQNVIPEGAFHSRLNKLPEEIAQHVTNKGIPVITEENGKVVQHAEIERQEIIFHKEATDKIEELFKQYEKAEGDEKDKIAILCGKYLTSQILENTKDNANLINNVK